MLLGVPLEIGINRLTYIERDGFHISQDILIGCSVNMVCGAKEPPKAGGAIWRVPVTARWARAARAVAWGIVGDVT